MLAANNAAAVVVRLNVCNILFCSCFFDIYTVYFSIFDLIFFESVPDFSIDLFANFSLLASSLKAVILPVNVVPVSLGILADGISRKICSRKGFKGPLAVHVPICVPKSSVLKVGLGTCWLIRLLEFNDLIWLI